MKRSPRNVPACALQRIRKSKMEKALTHLLEAYECAKEAGSNYAQFSLELVHLLNVGLTPSAVRWLLSEGYVEHFVETMDGNSPTRDLERTQSLSLFETSCLCLTADGVLLAVAAISENDSQSGGHPDANGQLQHSVPEWRADARELYFRGHLVKRFRVPAENQTAILQCFETKGWPVRIENPLCTDLDGEAIERLHDAIKRLNQRQHYSLIRFHGDGTGKGVMWDVALDCP